VLTVKAEGGCCWVVRLNRAAHDELLRQHPVAMAARVGKMMLVSMPLLLRVFDFGTTYGTLEAGEVRYYIHYYPCILSCACTVLL
jgi:hypothetical protein